MVGVDLRTAPGVLPVELGDPAAVAASMAGCEAIIHCAAIPSPERVEPAELVRNNTMTTFNALEEAWKAGIRTAVLASSGSIYGTAWSPEPILSLRRDASTQPYAVLAIASDRTWANQPTADLLRRYCPDTEQRIAFEGNQGAFDITRARELIGWQPR